MPFADPKKADESVRIISWRTPKQAILQVIKIGIAKSKKTSWRVAVLAFMAGAYIALGSLLATVVAGGSSAGFLSNDPGIVSALAGMVFPVGLMLVVVTGASLFTGNCMYMAAALFSRKVTIYDVLRNWFLSWTFNFFGAVFVMYFLAYLPDITASGPAHNWIKALAIYKIELGWGRVFLRGIGANWLVCAALYFAISADTMAGKINALWWPVFTFVSLKYEHSIADMAFVTLGIMEGADKTFWEFLWYNLLPATLGNIVGAVLLIVVVQWGVFEAHFANITQTLRTEPGAERDATHPKLHTCDVKESQCHNTSCNGHASPHSGMSHNRSHSHIDDIELSVNHASVRSSRNGHTQLESPHDSGTD
jgi:formate transporter